MIDLDRSRIFEKCLKNYQFWAFFIDSDRKIYIFDTLESFR
ncbi:hypothetical protein H1P_450003 [Hyella patelloides LEGE 07179]|uniref:Uncharacterized protein n=1 Tax=Hyella patelloides LEGE 07179 TaxID=945734 RepID=A0A563VYE8_9CYAN|nr:hypothetical protein H1P_450003 [Hyella patelloides LEGE 07179]